MTTEPDVINLQIAALYAAEGAVRRLKAEGQMDADSEAAAIQAIQSYRKELKARAEDLAMTAGEVLNIDDAQVLTLREAVARLAAENLTAAAYAQILQIIVDAGQQLGRVRSASAATRSAPVSSQDLRRTSNYAITIGLVALTAIVAVTALSLRRAAGPS